jgi:hypothetical protein
MIEILNLRPINKGALQSFVNIKLSPIGLIINKISVFMKDDKRWINMPQEIFEEQGVKKYYTLIKFEDPAQMKKFQEAFLIAHDKFMEKEKNIKETSKVTPLLQSDSELPF